MENEKSTENQLSEEQLKAVSGGGKGSMPVCRYESNHRKGNNNVEKRVDGFWGKCVVHNHGWQCALPPAGCVCFGLKWCVDGWHKCKEDGTPSYRE